MCLPVQPYKVEREWEHAGLKCAVVQAREGMNRCGYVRVPPGHSMHGKDYDTPNVEVHGGLTFADIEPCAHEDGTGWWFGFDCAHWQDARYDPNMTADQFSDASARKCWEIHQDMNKKYPIRETEHYWTEAEVAAEAEQLAEQLSQM